MVICFHSLPDGNFSFLITCAKINMIIPATANLIWAMTNGWETSSEILVAVEADAHKKANATPAIIHLY
jgi:hypothetical protein